MISGHHCFRRPVTDGLKISRQCTQRLNRKIVPLALRSHSIIDGMFIHSLEKGLELYDREDVVALTSQGNFLFGTCHWSISQYTMAHEKTSTLWLYLGCACQSSGACQLTVPTKLRTIDRVDCFTLAKPKSAIFAVPREVMRMLDDLQSL